MLLQKRLENTIPSPIPNPQKPKVWEGVHHPAQIPKLTSPSPDQKAEENDIDHQREQKEGAKPQSLSSLRVPKAAVITTRGPEARPSPFPSPEAKAQPAPGMSPTLSTIYSEASTLHQVWAYKRSALEQGTAGSDQARQKLRCLGRQSTHKALKSPLQTDGVHP